MRSGFLILTLNLLLACSAQAGPWLREKGTAFTATSYTVNYFRDTTNTVYMEFGVREDLTLGADVAHSTSRFGVPSGAATLFLRRALGDNTGPHKWAYEVGLGAAWGGAAIQPHVKTGLLWGRGFQIKDRFGWLNVDGAVIWDINNGAHISKIDATVGMNFTEVTAGMMQLYLSHLNGQTYGTIAPSVILKPRKGKFRYHIGAESPIADFDSTSIKIGLWRDF